MRQCGNLIKKYLNFEQNKSHFSNYFKFDSSKKLIQKLKKFIFGEKNMKTGEIDFFRQNSDPLSLKFDENGPSGLAQM